MTVHKNVPLGQMHAPYNWEFANTAARYAVTGTTSADLGKFARQTSDDTLWMLTGYSPVAWVAVGGAGGGSSVATSTQRIYVDSENGADVTGRGGISNPYASLAYAASDQPNPTTLTEFSKEILFHVEPGTYTANVTLPYRVGISIEGELVDIVGHIYWYQNPSMFFGHAGGDYGRAALAIIGTNNSPIRITGDIIAKNVAPSATVPVGDKYLLAQKMVHQGRIMNLAAGATTSSNQSTGSLYVSMDWCTQPFGTANAGIFAEHETTGSLGQNKIILQGRHCALYCIICGNVQVEHLVSCGLEIIDYTVGYPAGGTLGSYSGNVGGATSPGYLGLIDCTYRDFHTADFDWGKHASNPYSIKDVIYDAYSFDTIGTYSSYFDMGTTPYQSRDKAAGIATVSSGWSGNLSSADTTVQAALTTLNALSVAAGGAANVREVWVDQNYGATSGTMGSQAVPYRYLDVALDSIISDPFASTYVFHIAPGLYSESRYDLVNKKNVILHAYAGHVNISNELRYLVDRTDGNPSGLTIIGATGVHSSYGSETDSVTSNAPGLSMDIGELTVRRNESNISADTTVYANLLNCRIGDFQAIKGLDSTPTADIFGCLVYAHAVNCDFVGTMGGSWENTTPDSNPANDDAGANPLYLKAENCRLDKVAGITELSLRDCVLTDIIDRDRDPTDWTTGYAGCIWIGERGWQNVTFDYEGTVKDLILGKNADWAAHSFEAVWNVDEVSRRTLFDGDFDSYSVTGYTTLLVASTGTQLALRCKMIDTNDAEEGSEGSCAVVGSNDSYQLPEISAANHGQIVMFGFATEDINAMKIYPATGDSINSQTVNIEYWLSERRTYRDGCASCILQADNDNGNWIVMSRSRERMWWAGDTTVSGDDDLVFRGRGTDYYPYSRSAEYHDILVTAIDYANDKTKVWELKLCVVNNGSANPYYGDVITPVAQIESITTDTKANTAASGYIDIASAVSYTERIWMDVSGSDSAPASGGFTLRRCNISGATTANDVAAILSGVITATINAHTCPATTTPLTATRKATGYLPTISMSGLSNAWSVDTTTRGAGPFEVNVLYQTDTAGGDTGTALWDIRTILSTTAWKIETHQRYDANIRWFAEIKGGG